MNEKENRGITLVALVITIIVLIILAGVSINAVMNDGLIGNAKNARDDYEAAKRKEEIALIDLEVQTDFLNASTPYNFNNGYLTGVEEGTEVGNLNLPTGYKIIVYNQNSKTFEESETTAKVATGMIVKKGDKEVGKIIIYGDIPCSVITVDDENVILDNAIGEGSIDLTDEANIEYYMYKLWPTWEEYAIIAMDVNHDNIINEDDTTLLNNYLFYSGEEVEQNVPAPSYDDIVVEFAE